jgi:hypothetical protein
MHHATAPRTDQKQTLWGWSSISRQTISTDQSSSSTGLILAWTGTNNRIYFANSTDKVHWTMPSTSPLSYQSAWAPSLVAFCATAMPTHWLAWTGSGTTSTRLLNVQYTQHYPSWGDAGSAGDGHLQPRDSQHQRQWSSSVSVDRDGRGPPSERRSDQHRCMSVPPAQMRVGRSHTCMRLPHSTRM